MTQLLLWFDQIHKDDVPLVGGKSASLGEMTSRTKVPVPYGFALTADAYRFFCGQAPSVYPEFTRFLVEAGIDSASVNPDVAVQTKRLFAQVEQRILLEKATGQT